MIAFYIDCMYEFIFHVELFRIFGVYMLPQFNYQKDDPITWRVAAEKLTRSVLELSSQKEREENLKYMHWVLAQLYLCKTFGDIDNEQVALLVINIIWARHIILKASLANEITNENLIDILNREFLSYLEKAIEVGNKPEITAFAHYVKSAIYRWYFKYGCLDESIEMAEFSMTELNQVGLSQSEFYIHCLNNHALALSRKEDIDSLYKAEKVYQDALKLCDILEAINICNILKAYHEIGTETQSNKKAKQEVEYYAEYFVTLTEGNYEFRTLKNLMLLYTKLSKLEVPEYAEPGYVERCIDSAIKCGEDACELIGVDIGLNEAFFYNAKNEVLLQLIYIRGDIDTELYAKLKSARDEQKIAKSIYSKSYPEGPFDDNYNRVCVTFLEILNRIYEYLSTDTTRDNSQECADIYQEITDNISTIKTQNTDLVARLEPINMMLEANKLQKNSCVIS